MYNLARHSLHPSEQRSGREQPAAWLRVAIKVTAASIALWLLHAPLSAAAQEQPERDRMAIEVARLTEQLESGDEEERLTAAIRLSGLEDKRVAPVLRNALKDRSPLVREAAVTGLGYAAEPAFAEAVIDALTRDRSEKVRQAAAYSLGLIPGPRSVEGLIRGLGDRWPSVRGASAIGLGRQSAPESVSALINALNDGSPFVRAEAARALGRVGPAAAAAVSHLIGLLERDSDGEVRRQAATALGLIGDRSALDALEAAARGSDPYLSARAREAIRRLKEGTGTPGPRASRVLSSP